MQLSTEVVDDVGVIRVRGDVDTLTAPKLHQTATELLGDGARSLVIDCRDIDFIASDGLGVMMRLHEQTQAQGGTLTVRRPRAFIYRLMQITRLDTAFLIDGPPAPTLLRSAEPDDRPSVGGAASPAL